MKKKYLFLKDLFFTIPVSLVIGGILASIQDGIWWIGWLGFSALLLVGLTVLLISWRWAGEDKGLAWMVFLTLGLRLLAGIAPYLLLPIDGYDTLDNKAGFIFTDARRRDDQAWELASSDKSILSAFNKTYHTDQYGGLLAFSALAYRYLSPDIHRPMLLIVLSAIIAALGVPFFWKAAKQAFGERVALISSWILVLYPESALLGGAAMREPYLITFSTMSLWGFIDWRTSHSRSAWLWLGIGLMGMFLVSPVVALATIVIFVGWLTMVRRDHRISWLAFIITVLVFMAGLFLLAWSLNRQGNFYGSPLGVVSSWFREAVRVNIYQLERGSGWVGKLFDEMPHWMRLPFVTIYGVLQPVLPAVFVEPTTLTWRIIGIFRALGWYLFLPLLVYAFLAAWKAEQPRDRYLWLWITTISWLWIIFTALRGGGDQWDNPRYRAILLVWQALAAGYAWTCYRSRSDPWLGRILIIEAIFLAFFTQWYLSRYLHLGGQIPFGMMVLLIIGCSLIVLVGGALLDRYRRRKENIA